MAAPGHWGPNGNYRTKKSNNRNKTPLAGLASKVETAEGTVSDFDKSAELTQQGHKEEMG